MYEENDARYFSFKNEKGIAEFLDVPKEEVQLAFAHARRDCKSDPITREQFGTDPIRT
jgi:hypothetical protein